MVAVLIPTCAFGLAVLAAHVCGGLPAGLAPLVVLGLGTLGGVVAGYAHVFPYYAGVLYIVGGLAGLYALGRLVRQIRRAPLHHDTGMLLGFIAVLFFYLWYYRGIHLSYFDEFFWGSFAKAFHYEGGMWSALSALARDDMSQAYPPMPAVLANLFHTPGGAFQEASIAVSGMTLVLATGAVAWHYARPHMQTPAALLVAVIVACTVRTFGAKCTDYYLVGYADYLQSALFAASLLIAVGETHSTRRTWLLCCVLPVLALCKQTGVIMSCWVIGLVALQLLVPPSPPRKRQLLALCHMSLLTGALYFTWQVYAKMHIAQSGGHGALLDITAALRDPMLWVSLNAYLWAAVERPLLVSPTLGWLSYITGTCVFVAGTVLTALLLRRSCLRLAQLLLLLLGLLAWFVLHWYAGYVYFPTPDLYNAACYERYIGSAVAGIWAVCVLLLACALAQRHPKGLLRGLTVYTLLLGVVCNAVPWADMTTLSLSPVRVKMEAAAQYLREHTEQGSTIYFIPDHNSTEQEWSLRYLLQPERKGTSLEVQALNVPGKPRLTTKGFYVPPKEKIHELLRKNAVDYVFIYDQDAVNDSNGLVTTTTVPYLQHVVP